MEPWDKLFLDQPFNRSQYSDTGRPFARAIYEAILGTCGVVSPRDAFAIEGTHVVSIEEMGSSAPVLAFLSWLLRNAGAKRALEIGTFVGISAMYFAKAMGAGGKVVTIEKFDHFAEIARRNVAANGLDGRVDVRVGDAAELLAGFRTEAPFDFVFVDGNKERYADYVEAAIPLLRAGGIVVVDDIFFHGDAVNPAPTSPKGAGARRCLELAARMADWPRCILPFSNGLLVMTKPSGPAA
ncbi:MAG: O-methyltransferase [Proteobacteria bacterium]|nr:O-methyltransferase [Pseudomonadota bacterium]